MRPLIAIIGLVLGILVGASLVLANPLAWLGGLPPLPEDLAPAKAYRWDRYRGVDGSAGDLLGIGTSRPKVALTDPALAHVRLGIIVLPAGQGVPAALAVKVSTIAEANSLWRARLGTDDTWTVFWPGEGSVFASSYSNFWAVNRDAFFAALRGGGTEHMAGEYPLSAPSPLGDLPAVTGATGRYADFAGEIREVLYPAAPSSKVTDPDWVIAIKANPPPVTSR